MAELSSCATIVSVVICVAVCTSGVQTQVATTPAGAFTVPPSGAFTVKTVLTGVEVNSRAGENTRAPFVRLTPCAQAILGCCAPEVSNRQHCFEQVGCGPHVFGNPCARDFMSQALGGAERFYSQYMPNTINHSE